MSKLKSPYIVSILVFIVYTASLFVLTKVFTSCLGSEDPVLLEECNVRLAFDRLIILILLGMISTIMALYLKLGRNNWKKILITSGILVLIAIAAYYAYLPYTLNRVYHSQIILTAPEGLEDVELNTP